MDRKVIIGELKVHRKWDDTLRSIFNEHSGEYGFWTTLIRALDAAIETLEDNPGQKAMKPERVNWIWNEFQCPACHQFYGDDEHIVSTINFCPHCGQPIDWEGVKK